MPDKKLTDSEIEALYKKIYEIASVLTVLTHCLILIF